MAKFQYKQRDVEGTKQRAVQSGSKFDSTTKPQFSNWTPKEGDHLIRIMPPTWDGAEHYGLDVWMHSQIGPDNQSYLCKAKMLGETCVCCEEHARATRAGEEEYAGEIKAYRRVMAWIIDRKEASKGPQLYTMPWTLDRDIAAQAVHKRTGEVLVIDHPEQGYDIEFTRQGTKVNTKYIGVKIDRRDTPLADDAKTGEGWLDFIVENPLPSTLNYYPDDHILAQMKGKAAKEESAERPTTQPAGPTTRADAVGPTGTNAPSAGATSAATPTATTPSTTAPTAPTHPPAEQAPFAPRVTTQTPIDAPQGAPTASGFKLRVRAGIAAATKKE